jgi:hypothetical protein
MAKVEIKVKAQVEIKVKAQVEIKVELRFCTVYLPAPSLEKRISLSKFIRTLVNRFSVK